MKCKKEGCGADLGPDAQFCSDCGTEMTTPTLIKSAICPSCNNLVLEVHKFCLKCGTQVDPALFTVKVCSGTKKDGGKCNTVLASGANFCPSCGISTLQADVTAVSREVIVASQKDHISVPITDSTERLNEEKGDSSRSGSGSSSPEIWAPPAIEMVHSEQKDDVNTSDQSEFLNAENNGQLTLNDNSPCPEETEINSSNQIELVGVQLSENDDRSKDGMTSAGSHQEVPVSSDSESVFTKKKNLELISSEDDIKENNGKQLKRKAKEKEKAETTKKEEETELCKLLEEINLTDKLTNETHVQNTQEIKEKPKKESSVDQQTEENEDKPNDSTELDKKEDKPNDSTELDKKEDKPNDSTELDKKEDKPNDSTELDKKEDKPNDSTELDKKEDKPNDSTELDKEREKITQDEKEIKEKPKKESSVDQQTEENEDKPNDSTELDKKEDKPNDSTELDKEREKITQDEKEIKEKPKKESSVDQQTEENEDKPNDSTELDKKEDKPNDSTELDKEREKITQDEKEIKEKPKKESSVDQQTEENEDKPNDSTELDKKEDKPNDSTELDKKEDKPNDSTELDKKEDKPNDSTELDKKEDKPNDSTELDKKEDKPNDSTELDKEREKITQDEKEIKEKPKKESSVDQQTEENEDKPNDSTELDKKEDKPNDSTELDKEREKITQDEKEIKEKPKKESSVDQQTEENEDKPNDSTELDKKEDKPNDSTELDKEREKITQDEKEIKEKPKKESSVDQQTEENEDKPNDSTELDKKEDKPNDSTELDKKEDKPNDSTELDKKEDKPNDSTELDKKEDKPNDSTELDKKEDKPNDSTELDKEREKITQDEKEIKEKPKKESSVDQQTEENEDKPNDSTELDKKEDKPNDSTELDKEREKITQDEKEIKEQPKKESSVDQQTEENEDKPNDSTELDKKEDKPNDSTELDKEREKITQDEKEIKEQPKKESSVDQQTEENEDKPNDSTELDKKEDKPNDSTELDKEREKITQDEKEIKEKPKKESSVDQQTEENEDKPNDSTELDKKEDKPNDSTELDKEREKITQDEKDIKEQPKKESSVDQQTEEDEDKPNDSTELDKGREKITQDELQAIEREMDYDSEDDDSNGPSSDRNKKEEQITGRITRSNAKATKGDANKTKNQDQTKNKETPQQKMSKSGTNKRLDGRSEKERTSSDAIFEVTFHAIMHSSIYDDTCTAYVRFSLDILGGWTSRKHKMHSIRKLEDDSFEVEGLVSIPRGHLSTTILFRYCVVCGDTEWEEFIYNQQNNMRTLYVIPNDIKLYDGRFHQYDGIIRVKEDKVGLSYYYYHYTGQEDSRYRKELHKDAVLSADVFLPVWQTVKKPSPGCSGEEMIMRIQSVLKGLQKTYWMLNITDDKFLHPFREALTSRFDALWQEFVGKKGREDRIKIMTNALTVICLFNEHNLTLSRDEGIALYRAILPECEKEGNKYMENIKEVFPQTFQMLPKQLLEFAKSGIKIFSPNWIFSMPMIHFLFNQCCPGEKPPDIVNHDSPIPEWWGIAKKEKYEFDLKEFKKKPIERQILEDILVNLSPYFEVDYLLPRTLMACLTLEQLPIVVRSGFIPPDITLASLCFHVKKELQISKNSDKEMAIIDCLTLVNSKLTNLKEDAERSTEVLSCALRSFLIAADVIKSMHERSGNKLTDNVMSLALESFLISLHVYCTTYTVLTETTGEQKRMKDYGRVLDSVKSSTRYWLNAKILNCKQGELLACLKSWNRVLNVAVPEGVIKDDFIKFIADTLYEQLNYKNFEEEVVKVYCKNQGFFCNAMLNILTKYAFGAVEKMSGTNFTYLKWKEGQLKNLGKLLSTVFEEKVGDLNVGDVSSILPFLLNWIPFPIFVKMFNNNIHAKFLSGKCVALMKDYNCCLVKVVEEINDRSVSVARLQIIEGKQEHLCSIITDIPGLDAKEFKISLQLRLAEMNAYNECIRNLKKFIDICQRCDANTSKLEEQFKRYQDFDHVSLKNICDKVKVPKDIKKYQPKVIAFEVDRYILDTLPEMIRCTKGNIFIITWDKFATEFHKAILRPLEIDELIEHVWKPTFREWRHLHHRLKTGEIFFSEFESICGRFDQKTLKREFLLLEGVESDNKIHWIQERIDQMNKYRNLQNWLDGASVIMEVVEEFELEGNFKAIEQILKLRKRKNTKMNKLKPSYLKTCLVLSDIDQKKINCLEKFNECKRLVNWLREKMPDGLQELKVFVDLAYISTGDDGIEIAKVRCLQSAAIGYAPLIFNLDPNCDYQVFLDRCKEVWKALDSNPNLPNELEDTNHELEWLKIVEESHGSVEVTSLKQAETINTSGTYYIGNVKKEKGKQQNCGLWHSAHIDDVHPPPDKMPSFIEMYHNPVSSFLQEEKKMNVEEENETLQIDILSLINNCVQPALSKVKDPEEDSQRTTERIRIILNLIQDSREKGDKSFLSGISVHLKSLLKEKEEQESELYKEWLSTETSNPDHINRAGTFRGAAIQCLEEKMTKLLAGVIAFIDTNRNMNIIVNEESQNWQRFLWIEILNCPPVTQLQNIDFAVSEFVVQGTAYEGGYFSAAMPYSWLIYRHIEKLLKMSFEEPQSQENLSSFEHVMRTADRFASTPLGQILSQIEGTDIQQVINCYIQDFIYMAHPVKTEPEHLVICENIWIGCKQIIQGEIGRLFPALVGCHATFQSHGARFRNFSDIVFVWPECSERTLKFQEGVDPELMYLVTTDEITLDLMGLHLLLNNLEPPSKDALNTPSSRKQWIKKMCDYRPVVERIFGYFQTEKHDSARCTQAVQTARYLWTRAVVVKLFIEHVCIEEAEIKKCRPLWVMLKKEADMKKLHSLVIVEKFLKSCNKDVSSKIFSQQTCVHCKEPYTGTPVTLPCSHTICRICYDETVMSQNLKCPKCDQRFQMDFNPIPADQSENIKTYQGFRRRCNSFFMEVVSQLCFAEGTPPSDEIINKLLSYITMHTRKGKEVTKELTIFDDCIDPTPVVRSFLLQHLMQTSGDQVYQHLENYFKNALGLVEPSKSNDLSLLVLRCMEDSYHQKYPEENIDQIVGVTDMLRKLSEKQNLDAEQLLQSIERLSHTRFALGIAANFMYKIFVEKSVKLDTRLKRLFGAVGKLCEECGSAWPRRYFVKYLCRCYGTDSYQTICTDCDVNIQRWISLPELQENKTNECYDRFVVCGENYIEKRDNFVKAALNQDAKKIIVLLQCKKNKWKTEIRFLLVVYREFTMKYLYEEEQQTFSPKVKQFLQRTLMNCQKLSDKDLIRDMLTNSLWRHDPHMNISPTMNLGQQGISCLVVHCMVLFRQIAGKQTLLTPLVNLANKPELMIESYFPTMPQDDLDEIKEALLTARPEDGNENPVFYRCPNGHLYVIGDCGRPEFVDRCKSCGFEIGGEGHELKEGNVRDEGIDTTDTGHILGRAKNMNAAPFPERKLNIANCAIIRLLTHMAMYIGANHNIQAVCRSIKPDIEDTDVPTYIMDHIQKDLQSISRVLGKSKEDILILIHQLLNDIMDSQTPVKHGEGAEEDICFLKCKKSRGIWEKNFNKHHIVPILEKNEDIINTVNTQIVNDQRLGANPMLQLLYETDNPTQQTENLGENPSVWQYRERISVDHLIQMFARSGQNCPVLQEFLEEEQFLRAIRFVPSIIQLQKILIQKYNRKLDRAVSSGLTMDKVLMEFENDPRYTDLEAYWVDFKFVWENIRQSLDGYGIPVDGKLVFMSRENCRKKIDDKTPISFVLPTHKESGLCSFALLFFLMEKQNLFLQKYCLQSKINYVSLPKVHVNDISSAHLISYHTDRDLLPMVLANCNYSFEEGQGTKVEYNFINLEKQLMDRLLFTKSVILLKEIETVVYRSESTNAVVFGQLRDKIKQERLSPVVLSQIQIELHNDQKTFPDLCNSMDKLDITIGFLKSVGSDPEILLNDFMVNTLKIDNTFVSQKANQSCKCKHTQSLWITLALEKNKRLEKSHKDSFEGVSSVFKKGLTDDQTDVLYELLDTLQLEQVEILMETLFECIILTIDIPQRDEEFVDMSKLSLADAMSGYWYDPPYTNDSPPPDWLKQFVEKLPKNLLCCYVAEIWTIINEIFTNKQEET